MIRFLSLVGALALAGLTTAPARAAESYDNCTGFITSLPATVTTQGVWCLKQHLSTAITSGAGITVATNNVTIDCNDFKIGGLAAGPSSVAHGILAHDRQNLTVRNCAIRGFHIGIGIDGAGGGHVIEDNRVDQSLYIGIVAEGDNNLVERNEVFDTGGKPGGLLFAGIRADADLIDNTVSGVLAQAPTSWPFGILVMGHAHLAQGNRVRNVIGPQGASGIVNDGGQGHTFVENLVDSPDLTSGKGIVPMGTCRGNSVRNFVVPYDFCLQDVDNATL